MGLIRLFGYEYTVRMDQADHPLKFPADALRAVIGAIGSQVATAKLLGVTQGTVSKWVQAHRLLPAEHVLRVEAATGISRHQLRPDIYPLPEVPAGRTVGTGAPVVSFDRGAALKRAAGR